MYGWTGAVLRANLTSGEISKEPLDEKAKHEYVGGRGLNIKLLFDEIRPGVDPLGPDNKLFFSVGPACGTPAPGSSRFTTTARSPLSGFVGDTSCGGTFGCGLKYAGYDALIIEGKAERPVYIWIDDDRVEIRDAQGLWGKTTGQTREMILTELGDPNIHTVCIGPGGEKLVRFACIVSGGRAGGRTGTGAVCGSKNLKAVAARGTKGIRVADRQLLEDTVHEMYREWNPEKLERLRRYGSGTASRPIYAKLGLVGTKNYREGTFHPCAIVPDTLAEKYYIKPNRPCFACPVGCNLFYIVAEGPYAGVKGDGHIPTQQFFSRLGIADVAFILKAHSLLNDYGLDEKDAASVVAYVIECVEAGILGKKDLDGLEITWGDCDAVLKLIEMIVGRRGIGDLLAEGTTRAAQAIGGGSDKFVMCSKAMSIDSRDPRGSKGWALGYAVSSRGAEHCRHLVVDFDSGRGVADWYKDEIKGFKGLDPLSEAGKAPMLKWYEDVRAFEHCLEVCMFAHPDATEQPFTRMLARLYNGITGVGITEGEVNLIGERIVNLERAFNVREGLTRKDDSLPERFLKEPLPDGASKGQVVNLDFMLDEYYELRGWQRETGYPTKEKLEQLGLYQAARELRDMGRLAE